MNRIYEKNKSKIALTPVSLAKSTDSTAIYNDCRGTSTVDFVITHGAIASGKKIVVTVKVADDASGTNAASVATKTFTASAAMTNGILVASIDVAGERPGFYGVVVSHDNTDAVPVAATMIAETIYSDGEDCFIRA